ncbi:MAG TPA: hypothetical protein DFR83_23210, partial [Deltaproteobacteria bacterium]|nr:hypothetical protein [Deltaproteobacteria bacterium]
RSALPGRGLRTLSLDAELPEDGLVDIWITRRTAEQPRPGDLLLRLNHAGAPAAQMFTWDERGPQRVTCTPSLELHSTPHHAVGIEAAEGLLDVTLDGQPSTCAAVAGLSPPAIRSGWHGVRLSNLAIDGRSIPAPTPGPLPLWVFLGGFLSLGLTRLEQTSGASVSVSAVGDLLMVCAVALALAFSSVAPGGGAAVVLIPIALALFLRLCIHISRALRPIDRRTDWAPTAAAASVLPAIGLWLLSTPTEGPSAMGTGLLGAVLGTLALMQAIWKRPAPWRAATLMAAIISFAALLGRLTASASFSAIFTGTLFGMATASAAGLASRYDRHRILRLLPMVLSIATAVCAADVLRVQSAPLPDAQRLQPDRRSGPIPAVPKTGVLVSGPLALGAPNRGRPTLPPTIGGIISLHPIGDGSWGPADVAAALAHRDAARSPAAVIVTANSSLELSPTALFPPWFPKLSSVLEAEVPRQQRHRQEHLQASLSALAEAMAPAPVLFVSGTHGPDAAPVRTFQTVFEQAAQEYDHVTYIDFADRVEQRPDEGWIDDRGMLTERAWDELAGAVLAGLEHP